MSFCSLFKCHQILGLRIPYSFDLLKAQVWDLLSFRRGSCLSSWLACCQYTLKDQKAGRKLLYIFSVNLMLPREVLHVFHVWNQKESCQKHRWENHLPRFRSMKPSSTQLQEGPGGTCKSPPSHWVTAPAHSLCLPLPILSSLLPCTPPSNPVRESCIFSAEEHCLTHTLGTATSNTAGGHHCRVRRQLGGMVLCPGLCLHQLWRAASPVQQGIQQHSANQAGGHSVPCAP